MRKVVCACSKGDLNNLLSTLGNRGNNLVLLGLVNMIVENNNPVREVISEEFRIQVGNGQHTDFWADDWIGSRPLRVQFPRIFACALSKEGRVSEFGC